MSGSDASRDVSVAPLHRLRFVIEAGVRVCLWAQDEATKARFGYAVWLDGLGLPPELVEDANQLMSDFDHALAAHDPGGEVEVDIEVDSGPDRVRV